MAKYVCARWYSLYHAQARVAYFDKDDVRIITVNTSDLPYELDEQGKKNTILNFALAIREDQMQEIIEILENSNGKTIIFMSHANPITHGERMP